MEMATSICRIDFEDEQVTRKRKSNEEVDQFVYLPDDMLLDILKRLPRGFLCYKAKFVCRRWLDIISNRILLDSASFILQKTGNLTARHVRIGEKEQGLQVKVENLDIPRIGIIRSWCNELILISNYKDIKQSLYIYNLFTEEGSYLPECNVGCGGFCTFKCGLAISFDGFKGIYKVVHLFMGPPTECHILILREDIVSSKWKKIQVPFMDGGRLHSSVPVSVEGRYFHWEFPCDTRLVSIDMVKEEIVNMSLPLRGIIFEMGGSLALFAGDTAQKAEIWILKDFKRKKWEKLQSVTLEKWYYRRFPVCGLMSNRYIILECKYSNGMCYYDLKNRVVKKLDINIEYDDGYVFIQYQKLCSSSGEGDSKLRFEALDGGIDDIWFVARIEDIGGHAGELHNIVVPILIVASSPEKMTGLPNMVVVGREGE
ncbi:hypothetical protein L1887_04999 [Cichorium endivia]|nr:hypothetical protein L1887_04999 [Cichorium endivia]